MGLSTPEWKETLQAIARACGHEMRNSLNALAVNLEVVRSRTASSRPSVEPFMTQAIEQSEESVRLAESAIALLTLVTGAIGRDGKMNLVSDGPRGLAIESGPDTDRLCVALHPLVARGALSAEKSGTTVILRAREGRLD